ncbi:hypothetical protein NDU88_000872 [Pleurodeles waltl]|uniref:Uncharacterized protein n=1 Tax=Pleurodeles waltl TaxID=8319 RepID=A0AAV7WML5_PLEWA|nr:hypothetical protein NDU88_000872 [Pleurodeles waltl]
MTNFRRVPESHSCNKPIGSANVGQTRRRAADRPSGAGAGLDVGHVHSGRAPGGLPGEEEGPGPRERRCPEAAAARSELGRRDESVK